MMIDELERRTVPVIRISPRFSSAPNWGLIGEGPSGSNESWTEIFRRVAWKPTYLTPEQDVHWSLALSMRRLGWRRIAYPGVPFDNVRKGAAEIYVIFRSGRSLGTVERIKGELKEIDGYGTTDEPATSGNLLPWPKDKSGMDTILDQIKAALGGQWPTQPVAPTWEKPEDEVILPDEPTIPDESKDEEDKKKNGGNVGLIAAIAIGVLLLTSE